MTWVGLGAIGFAAVTFTADTPYPGTLVAVPVVGTALVIAGGTPVPPWAAERLLRVAPVAWFGRLSYSLYLWHWPILIIAAEQVGQNGLSFRRNVPWLAVALAAAVITHVCVENPVRHARALARRRWLSIGLGAVLVATSLLVATVAIDIHQGAATPRGHGTASGPVRALSALEVTRLVESATLIQSVPADLRPSLDEVSANWGGPTAPCWPSYSQVSIPERVFGNPKATHTLALYGDSHAAMWFDAIDLIAQLSGWKVAVLAKGDCPAIGLVFPNPPGFARPGGPFIQCDEWHQFALARIEAVHADLVIVTQESDLGPGGPCTPTACGKRPRPG
jgi:hypothetical protein